MIRKFAVAILILLVVVGALVGIKMTQIRALIAGAKAYAPPPEAVSAFVARQEKWQSTISAIGSIAAVQGVTITPDIPGTVREIAFESGATVAKGDLLVRLDTSSEEAQLRAAEAQSEWARLNLDRVRKLRSENTVSASELDSAEATTKQNQANADTIRATIEKKTIRAPFGGRLGIRQINLGQYLDVGKAIVSLQSLTPVHADFSLPQQELSRLSTGMKVRLTSDAYPDRQFEGTLTAINPDLDSSTRSIGLQATLENSDQALRPGMFARIEVVLPEEKEVLVIPATAVLSNPYGDAVYVIGADTTRTNGQSGLIVRQQFIRTGRTRGDYVTVESGLKPGERIVSAGLFKLRNNMSVVENNELVPKSSELPRPSDS
jgi:membrane fusion protein, multidrug efflux system